MRTDAFSDLAFRLLKLEGHETASVNHANSGLLRIPAASSMLSSTYVARIVSLRAG